MRPSSRRTHTHCTSVCLSVLSHACLQVQKTKSCRKPNIGIKVWYLQFAEYFEVNGQRKPGRIKPSHATNDKQMVTQS